MVGVATTDDLADYERVEIISPPENKDAALFPEMFDDRYVVIHRPVFKGPRPEAHMWISFSPDMRHWGDHKILLRSRSPGYWDSERVGLGPPPLRTERGWLLLYHGVKETVTGSLYRAGLAVLDLDDPTIVLARTHEWVLGPEAHYEYTGDVPGVVFPTGWVTQEDGTVRIYYGAADTCIGLATADLGELIDFTFTTLTDRNQASSDRSTSYCSKRSDLGGRRNPVLASVACATRIGSCPGACTH